MTPSLTGPMRTVVVGQEPHPPFLLHHNILCKSSEPFKSKATWPEAVELPASNYEAFQLYSSWLYAGRIASFQDDIHIERISWPLLAHAYVLAEAIQDCRLKDLIIDCMYDVMTSHSAGMKYFFHLDASKVITTIYNGTPLGSPVRLFLSQVSTWDWLDHRRHMLPNDFIFNLARLLACAMNAPQLARLSKNKCTYHSHPIDVDDDGCANDRACAGA